MTLVQTLLGSHADPSTWPVHLRGVPAAESSQLSLLGGLALSRWEPPPAGGTPRPMTAWLRTRRGCPASWCCGPCPSSRGVRLRRAARDHTLLWLFPLLLPVVLTSLLLKPALKTHVHPSPGLWLCFWETRPPVRCNFRSRSFCDPWNSGRCLGSR